MVKILGMGIFLEIAMQSEYLEKKWATIKRILNMGLHFGEGEDSVHITIGLLLLLTIALLITGLLIRVFKRIFTRKMSDEDRRKTYTIIRFAKFLIYLGVVIFTLGMAGVDITILITASAALFVGLGLALQQSFQDILGGIFIITDKSVQVGDVVEIDGKVGKVFEIKLRTTRATTRDDKVLIIPNHKFINDVTFNYTQNYPKTRDFVRVGVSYGSDVQLVSRILIECAEAEPRIGKEPPPFVLFDDFGDSALIFTLHFFIRDSFQALKIKSSVRYMIDEKFRESGVVIPFPQRDVHLFPSAPASGQRGSSKHQQESK